jgi:hypothetical protein
MLTYSASLAAAPVKVLAESATLDLQCSIAPGSFKDGQIGAPGRTALRADSGAAISPASPRGLADAAGLAVLCRGAIAELGRGAGHNRRALSSSVVDLLLRLENQSRYEKSRPGAAALS